MITLDKMKELFQDLPGRLCARKILVSNYLREPQYFKRYIHFYHQIHSSLFILLDNLRFPNPVIKTHPNESTEPTLKVQGPRLAPA